MGAKISADMLLALKYLDMGYLPQDAADKAGVSVRGLRYAKAKRKSKKVLDKRK